MYEKSHSLPKREYASRFKSQVAQASIRGLTNTARKLSLLVLLTTALLATAGAVRLNQDKVRQEALESNPDDLLPQPKRNTMAFTEAKSGGAMSHGDEETYKFEEVLTYEKCNQNPAWSSLTKYMKLHGKVTDSKEKGLLEMRESEALEIHAENDLEWFIRVSESWDETYKAACKEVLSNEIALEDAADDPWMGTEEDLQDNQGKQATVFLFGGAFDLLTQPYTHDVELPTISDDDRVAASTFRFQQQSATGASNWDKLWDLMISENFAGASSRDKIVHDSYSKFYFAKQKLKERAVAIGATVKTTGDTATWSKQCKENGMEEKVTTYLTEYKSKKHAKELQDCLDGTVYATEFLGELKDILIGPAMTTFRKRFNTINTSRKFLRKIWNGFGFCVGLCGGYGPSFASAGGTPLFSGNKKDVAKAKVPIVGELKHERQQWKVGKFQKSGLLTDKIPTETTIRLTPGLKDIVDKLGPKGQAVEKIVSALDLTLETVFSTVSMFLTGLKYLGYSIGGVHKVAMLNKEALVYFVPLQEIFSELMSSKEVMGCADICSEPSKTAIDFFIKAFDAAHDNWVRPCSKTVKPFKRMKETVGKITQGIAKIRKMFKFFDDLIALAVEALDTVNRMLKALETYIKKGLCCAPKDSLIAEAAKAVSNVGGILTCGVSEGAGCAMTAVQEVGKEYIREQWTYFSDEILKPLLGEPITIALKWKMPAGFDTMRKKLNTLAQETCKYGGGDLIPEIKIIQFANLKLDMRGLIDDYVAKKFEAKVHKVPELGMCDRAWQAAAASQDFIDSDFCQKYKDDCGSTTAGKAMGMVEKVLSWNGYHPMYTPYKKFTKMVNNDLQELAMTCQNCADEGGVYVGSIPGSHEYFLWGYGWPWNGCVLGCGLWSNTNTCCCVPPFCPFNQQEVDNVVVGAGNLIGGKIGDSLKACVDVGSNNLNKELKECGAGCKLPK